MENSEIKEFDKDDQKLINEFIKSENLTIDEIDTITETEVYECSALEIQIGSQEWFIILDDTNMDRNCLEFMKDEGSEYPYFYTEGIKSGDIDPVSTSFMDWIDQIIQYDGWISVVGSYDGDYNELTGNSVYFRRN
tara:strand:+ start:211 stop:618 length:408 start_codon:yes stop_codon:yes gene_type:complete